MISKSILIDIVIAHFICSTCQQGNNHINIYRKAQTHIHTNMAASKRGRTRPSTRIVCVSDWNRHRTIYSILEAASYRHHYTTPRHLSIYHALIDTVNNVNSFDKMVKFHAKRHKIRNGKWQQTNSSSSNGSSATTIKHSYRRWAYKSFGELSPRTWESRKKGER